VNSPNRSIDRTFRSVFSLDSTPRTASKTARTSCDKRKKGTKGQKHHRNPVVLAREWKEALDRGEYKSQADLARKKGVSRARVTQIMNLLKLDSEVQEMVVRLGDPLPTGSVTERNLRGLSSLSAREQRTRMRKILSFS
jgi:hypothetical protein